MTVHIPLQVLNQVTAGRLRLADPGPARGARHRADPVAAQADARATSCRRRTSRRAVAATGRPAPGAAAGRRWRASCSGWSGSRSRRRTSTSARVPDHLKITFRVVDERRSKLAEDKDLEALQAPAEAEGPQAIAGRRGRRAAGIEQRRADGLDDRRAAAHLRDPPGRAAGQGLPGAGGRGRRRSPYGSSTPSRAAAQAMWPGTRRLILLDHPVDPAKFASGPADQPAEARAVPQSARLRPGAVRRLRDLAAADRLIADHGGPAVGRGVASRKLLRHGARRPRRH